MDAISEEVVVRKRTRDGREDSIMTPEFIETVKDTICKGFSDAHFKLFVYQCQRLRLDPMCQQIYAIPRGGNLTIQVSINGLRAIAHRTGNFHSRIGPLYCGLEPEEGWSDVWKRAGDPYASKVTIKRKDGGEFSAVALHREYAPAPKKGLWITMGCVMLGKCAESQALRAAFSEELGSLYSPAEFGEDD